MGRRAHPRGERRSATPLRRVSRPARRPGDAVVARHRAGALPIRAGIAGPVRRRLRRARASHAARACRRPLPVYGRHSRQEAADPERGRPARAGSPRRAGGTTRFRPLGGSGRLPPSLGDGAPRSRAPCRRARRALRLARLRQAAPGERSAPGAVGAAAAIRSRRRGRAGKDHRGRPRPFGIAARRTRQALPGGRAEPPHGAVAGGAVPQVQPAVHADGSRPGEGRPRGGGSGSPGRR